MIDTSVDLKSKIQNHSKNLEVFLNTHFHSAEEVHATGLSAMRYSLLQKGAKRFRANLACFTTEALGADLTEVLPFAAALECVHTYSLIHDDLPCMDNDDFRRGEATNHKVYGDATALLAGDALITEAFTLLADRYAIRPEIGLKLVSLLSKAAGMRGMISGQMRDLETGAKPLQKIEDLKLMHEQKTGALILVAIQGAALIGGASPRQSMDLLQFGRNLGLAFQVKDDLLDFQEDKGTSYTSFMGFAEAEKFLAQLTEQCLHSLKDWDEKSEPLRQMAKYNFAREN